MAESRKDIRGMLILIVAVSFQTIAFPEQSAAQHNVPSQQPQAVKRVPFGCVFRSGITCMGQGWRCLVMFPAQESTRHAVGKAFAVQGIAEVHEGRRPKLVWEFTAPPSRQVPFIPILKDVQLEKWMAESLGFKRVTILKGKYRINTSAGTFGGVVFNVSVKKRATQKIAL